MSKHTPGPWVVTNGHNIFTGLGAPNAEGTEAPSNDGWTIADCDMGGLSYHEVKANARLIAQAPRLLEALEALLARDERNTCQHEETHRGGAIWEICNSCGMKWSDDRDPKPEWREPKEWIEARAAIKAAKGESND